MIRVSSVVSANLSGASWNPGASSQTIPGAVTMPSTIRAVTMVNSVVKVALASSHASRLDLSVWYSVNTGMKAEDIEPSANNSRNKFGTRYATKKASAAGVAPNSLASTMSRMNPRIRLENVAMPIKPAAWTTE